MLLTFSINKQLICRTDKEIPVAKSENYLYAQFSFSEEWTGTKTAIFNNGTAYSIQLDENNECLVPWEVITESGFSVSVFCGQRITANVAFVDVIPSGYIEGETPTPPSKTVYEQILDELAERLSADDILPGANVTVTKNADGTITISAQGGGASDYTDLENKPSINSVELVGNKSLADLGIQPSGDYATNTALGEEETARQNADNNLQGQIDAITVSSDVVDVVGTYQDLVNYDTQHIKANDIIKVMQDSTHSNAISYYRWVITEGVGAWTYVGSEGPYYTKGEADVLLQGKINVQQSSSDSGKALMVGDDGTVSPQNIPQGTTDYTDLTNKPSINSVELSGNKTSADLGLFKAPLIFTNKAVAQNDWTDQSSNPDTGFEDYTYKGVISNLTGVTASMLATVIFADEEAKSGKYALTCVTGSNSVTIYSNDNSAITIPTIIAGTPVEVEVNPYSLVFSDITVATSDWESDSTYSGYNYKAVITCSGVKSTDIADVYLDGASSALGIIAEWCDEGTDSVTIYSTSNDSAVIIKRIEVR